MKPITESTVIDIDDALSSTLLVLMAYGYLLALASMLTGLPPVGA